MEIVHRRHLPECLVPEKQFLVDWSSHNILGTNKVLQCDVIFMVYFVILLFNMEVFQYPLREELFQRIQSPRQLKQLLEREATHLRINKQYFKVTLQMNRYIYARCRQCKSSMKFKREEDEFRLTSFNFNHHHEHKKKSNEIEDFIKSMPLSMSTQSLMQITTRNFNISKHKFYYHHRKIWFEKTAFKEIINELDHQKHETRLVPFPLQDGDLPDIFLTASP